MEQKFEALYSDNFELNIRLKYADIWDKKYRDKGQAIWVFQRRTLSSACVITAQLRETDFDKATTFMFHLAKNAGDCKSIIEAFNSQLELAMVNPDKFIRGFHKFFQGLTKQLKKEKKVTLYFKALAYIQECSHNGLLIDGQVEHNLPVEHTTIDALMQGTEYFKKQDYDVMNVVVGISSEKEPIIIRDPYPLADVPAYYLEALIAGKAYDKNDRKIPKEQCFDMMPVYYERFGYKGIDSEEKAALLSSATQIFNNTVLSMATITNEYTVDMLPDKPLTRFTPAMKSWWPKLNTFKHNTEFYKDALHHRRRTLPANGAIIQFGACQFIREIRLKETCRDNEIVCIYKIVTAEGDLSGYYNTNTGWLYSVLDGGNIDGCNAGEIDTIVMNLVLWLYTSLVCDLPDILPTDASFQSFFETHQNAPTNLKFMTLGGKPRNYLKKDYDDDSQLRVFDKSKYDASSKNINGFVRRLPAGQKASERSLQIAKSYGFELHDDETYVMPFVRRQWLKKKTEE